MTVIKSDMTDDKACLQKCITNISTENKNSRQDPCTYLMYLSFTKSERERRGVGMEGERERELKLKIQSID